MPLERHRYPAEWEEIATSIKEEAGWACENCGKVCRRAGESLVDFARRSEDQFLDVLFHPRRYALQAAHLDQKTDNNERSNLKALCCPCHLRHDRPFMKQNIHDKKERLGQIPLALESQS